MHVWLGGVGVVVCLTGWAVVVVSSTVIGLEVGWKVVAASSTLIAWAVVVSSALIDWTVVAALCTLIGWAVVAVSSIPIGSASTLYALPSRGGGWFGSNVEALAMR